MLAEMALLSEQQREAVARRYASHVVYQYLCVEDALRGQENSGCLHPADLFYALFVSMDSLIALPEGLREEFCSEGLWLLLRRFFTQSATDGSEQGLDCPLLVGTIQLLARLLLLCSAKSWRGVAAALVRGLANRGYAPSVAWSVHSLHDDDLSVWIDIYLQCRLFFSVDIYSVIRQS